MNLKAIVFDVFGVVSSEVAPYWLAHHFPPEKALELKTTLVHSADLGRITEPEMFEQLARLSGVAPQQVETEWWSYVHIDPDMVTYLTLLRPHYRLGLLTNSPSGFVRRILSENRLDERFDAVVVSSEVGIAKPARDAYGLILTKLGVSPAEAVMIDDNPTNVDAAIALGMQGIVFESVESLRRAIPLPSTAA